MIRVLLLGKGSLAVRAARWFQASEHHDLVAAVPVVPAPTWTESLADWCAGAGVPAATTGAAEDGLALAGEVDLTVSIFYDRILRPAFLARCGRAVNLHNGPLPRYRGVSPVNWALRNGELEHGVTLHEITPGVDDGPVLGRVTYSVYPEFDEVEEVYARALLHGWTLLETTLPLLDRIVPRPQDEALATHHTRRDDALLGDRAGLRRPR